MTDDPPQPPAPPGAVHRPEPELRLVLAPNPSPMTYWGTNSYLVGTGDVAVIDPGPDLPAHAEALMAALEPGERISHIFVTHAHLDHSPLARPLAAATGAPVLAFGAARDGMHAVMRGLLAQGLAGGGEGVDADFTPDTRLGDGETVAHGDWALTALHTPGHMSNHLSFGWRGAVFTGDHVMGWASSLVSPPDGDLTEFMASCARLARRDDRIYYPAHGAPITDPAARLAWLIGHRKSREAAILAALSDTPATIPALTAAIYTDTPAALIPAAERNVFAHLVDLAGRGVVAACPALSPTASYTRA